MIETKLISWFDDHFYKIKFDDGVEDFYPSVTSKLEVIAKPELFEWYGRVGTREARRISREAADRGSRIHYAWHVFCTGGAVIFSPYNKPVYSQDELNEILKMYGEYYILHDQDEAAQLLKLQAFHNLVKPEIVASERIVYNVSLREAGTLDNLMLIKKGAYDVSGADTLRLPEGLYVFDLKTTNAIYNEAKMQVARYAHFCQLAGEPVIGALIGWTGSRNRKGIPGFDLIYLDENDLKYYNRAYSLAAELWRKFLNNRKPKVMDVPSLMVIPKVQNEANSGV